MAKLHELPKIKAKRKKRQGQGYGSGKGGHTSGRGQKGQKSRGKVSLLFEGTKIKKSLLKRLPLLRGKGKLKPHSKPMVINLAYLNLLPKESIVDLGALIKAKIVDKNAAGLGVKILGEGELKIPLTVKLPVSKQARVKIEKAGGKVVQEEEISVPAPKKRVKKAAPKAKSAKK